MTFFWVSHLRLSQQMDDPVVGYLNLLFVIALCYKLIQLFKITGFIAVQYNSGYYGTYTTGKIYECFINFKQVFLLYQLGNLVRL